MQRTNPEKFESNFEVRLFNPKKPSDIEELNKILDVEIARKAETSKPMDDTLKKMVQWLKTYVNSDEFINQYKDEKSLELIAEGTFWSTKFGLADHVAKMSYAEIRDNYRPLNQYMLEDTELSKLIGQVINKLARSGWSTEADYALRSAAYCIYVHSNGYENLKEEEAKYNSRKATYTTFKM